MSIPSESGIYVARPIEDTLVPVTRDPRHVETCARVNNRNVKVGKAKNLAGRYKNYCKDFDPENIEFRPIAVVEDFAAAETAILLHLQRYRLRSPKGRVMDWLAGIDFDTTIRESLRAMDNAAIPYEPLTVIKAGGKWRRAFERFWYPDH